jgi:hypothetical protein
MPSELAKIVEFQKKASNRLQQLQCYKTMISYDNNGNLACLYRIEKGFMEHSHGIEVAKIAGKVFRDNSNRSSAISHCLCLPHPFTVERTKPNFFE